MSVEVLCPMPGSVVQVLVKVGDKVCMDDELVLLESMKMEVPVCSPGAGCVTQIFVQEKDAVSPDKVLLIIE